jgi:hypothetical protein
MAAILGVAIVSLFVVFFAALWVLDGLIELWFWILRPKR